MTMTNNQRTALNAQALDLIENVQRNRRSPIALTTLQLAFRRSAASGYLNPSSCSL